MFDFRFTFYNELVSKLFFSLYLYKNSHFICLKPNLKIEENNMRKLQMDDGVVRAFFDALKEKSIVAITMKKQIRDNHDYMVEFCNPIGIIMTTKTNQG
jgi:hypothetical protein